MNKPKPTTIPSSDVPKKEKEIPHVIKVRKLETLYSQEPHTPQAVEKNESASKIPRKTENSISRLIKAFEDKKDRNRLSSTDEKISSSDVNINKQPLLSVSLKKPAPVAPQKQSVPQVQATVPVSASATTPVSAQVSAPVSTPVTASVAAPVLTPVSASISDPVPVLLSTQPEREIKAEVDHDNESQQSPETISRQTSSEKDSKKEEAAANLEKEFQNRISKLIKKFEPANEGENDPNAAAANASISVKSEPVQLQRKYRSNEAEDSEDEAELSKASDIISSIIKPKSGDLKVSTFVLSAFISMPRLT